MISFFGGPRGLQGIQGEKGNPGSPMNIIARYFTNYQNLSYTSNIFEDAGIEIFSDETCNTQIEKNKLKDFIKLHENNGEIKSLDPDTPWIAIINIFNDKPFAYKPENITITNNDEITVESVLGINLTSDILMFWEDTQESFAIEKRGTNIDGKNKLILDFNEKTISLSNKSGEAPILMPIPKQWDETTAANLDKTSYITPQQASTLITNSTAAKKYDIGQYYISAFANKDTEPNSPFIKCNGDIIKANDEQTKQKYEACVNFLNFKENYTTTICPKFYYTASSYHAGRDSNVMSYISKTQVLTKAENDKIIAELYYGENMSGLILMITDKNTKKTSYIIFQEKNAYNSRSYYTLNNLKISKFKGSLVLKNTTAYVLFFFQYNNKTYYIQHSESDLTTYANKETSKYIAINSLTALSVNNNNSTVTLNLDSGCAEWMRFLDNNNMLVSGTMNNKPGWYLVHWGAPSGFTSYFYVGTTDPISTPIALTAPISWVSLKTGTNTKLYYLKINGSMLAISTSVGTTFTTTATPATNIPQAITNFLNLSGHHYMQYGSHVIENNIYQNYNLILNITNDKSQIALLHSSNHSDLANSCSYYVYDFSNGDKKTYLPTLNFNYSFATNNLIVSGAAPKAKSNGYEAFIMEINSGNRTNFYNNTSTQITYSSQTSLTAANVSKLVLTNHYTLPMMEEQEQTIDKEKNNTNFSYIGGPFSNYSYLYYFPIYYTITKTKDLILPNLCQPEKQLYYYLTYQATTE